MIFLPAVDLSHSFTLGGGKSQFLLIVIQFLMLEFYEGLRHLQE